MFCVCVDIVQEGIFRRTGSVARQNELRSRLNGFGTNGVAMNLDSGTYSVHDVASVLKGILADLPEPLLTDTYCPAHVQMAGMFSFVSLIFFMKKTKKAL